MKRFLKDYRLHEYTEALFLLTLGIIIQVLDGSPLDVNRRWTLAWETEFPREYFSAFIQRIIKTVLSMIILARCLTSVLYVLFGFVVAYCILKETSPKLMLPWLFISGVKSVLLTFLETLTGVYVCSSFGKIRKPCVEFVISKAVELFFAIYLWACIRSIHKDMERYEEDVREEVLLTKMVIQRVNFRRRRARSMVDQTTLYKTANLNYFELKDVPNIIFDMLKTEEELSQDSLFSPGMMLASVSNMGSYDYLKTSYSLGELGFMDLNSFQVVGLDDDRRICPYKRAMKFLKLTRDDIQKAKEITRRDSFIQNYEAPEEIPWNIIDSKHSINHQRCQRHEEIFVAQLPDPDKVKSALRKKKRRQLPQDDILSDYDTSEEESRASDEKIIGLEEGEAEENVRDDESLTISAETDGETTPDLWFMTNRKDEVNRIGLFETHTTKRADNYERLYKQDFMSDIGPEVFDRASKLVKLTSLSDINARSSGLAGRAQALYPSTSRDPDMIQTDTAESEESTEQAKRQKYKKKISFEDHYDSHTTMPLSIIVTNFPVNVNEEISKGEALYINDAVPKRSGILFLPDSYCKLSSGKCGMNDVYNEVSHGMEISPAEVDSEDETSPSNSSDYRLKQTDSNFQRKKFNLYVLKYFKNLRSDFKRCRVNSASHKKASQKGSGVRKVGNLKLPILKSPSSLSEENAEIIMDEFIYPRMHEQILFTRDLMKRPIRDVLKSYYNLRELDIRYSKHLEREACSFNSHRKAKKRITRESRNSKFEKYLKTRRNSEKKQRNASNHETQVYFIEEDLRSYDSLETVSLACPKSEKMNSKGKNKLLPLQLFGNKEIGWSSMPVIFKDGHNPFNRSCTDTKDMPGPGLPDWEEQDTSAVNKRHNSSFGLVISSDFQIRRPKEDSPCSTESNASIGTLKPSEAFSCKSVSNEFHLKNPDSASPQDMRKFIYPDLEHYTYKTLNKKGSDVDVNQKQLLFVNDSPTVSPSAVEKKTYSIPSPETRIMRRPMIPNFQSSFDSACSSYSKTSDTQSRITDQKTASCVVNPDRANDKTSPTYKAGEKKKKKLLKYRNEEKSSCFGPKRATTKEAVDTSSTHLGTNAGRALIVRNPVAILQRNVFDKKYIQRVRQEGYSSFYP